MKRLIIILTVLLNVTAHSQTEFQKFESKYDEFDFYAKPSPKNELSRFFRNHINTSLLDAVKFRDTIEANKRIFLVFHLNSKNELTGLSANSAYAELNKSITDAFRKYDIEKLNIPNKNRLDTYVLQIISSENGKAILNCSTEIVYDKLPILEGCESIKTHNELKKCNNKSIEKHIVNTISFAKIQSEKILGELKLSVKFLVDYDGGIKNIECKAPTEALTEELNRMMETFPKAKVAPTRNGNPTFWEIKEHIFLIIEPKTESYKDEVQKSKDTLLDENSDLALHFKKYITDTELQNIKLQARQHSVIISFSIDKNGRYIDVSNNIKDVLFNEKLNSILRTYPIEKHGIGQVDLLAKYSYSVITKGYDNYTIQTQQEPMVMLSPIFKGCEKEKSFNDIKKCNSVKVGYQINKEFDKNLRSKTDLKGDIRIFCVFKVDTDGKIVDVKVQAPNPFLANEVESIIKSLPPVIKPGIQNGKPVKVPFSLPVVFRVGENRPEDLFKSSIRKQ